MRLIAHEFMLSGDSAFTTSMYACNALFWVAAAIAGGWIAVLIARRRESGWVLATVLMMFLCFMHLYLEWDRFPGWYNLAVALPSGAAVVFGGWLARGFTRARAVDTGAAGAAHCRCGPALGTPRRPGARSVRTSLGAGVS